MIGDDGHWSDCDRWGLVQIIEATALGIRSAVLTMRRRDTPLTFVIYPMVHIADPLFYRQVSERLSKADLIVVEGVGRSTIGWALTMTYRVVPHRRNSKLVEDNIRYRSLGVPLIRPDSTGTEFRVAWATVPWWQRAIVWCVIPGIVLTRLFGGSRRMLQQYMELAMDDLPTNEEQLRRPDVDHLDRVILDERDQKLVAALTSIHIERANENLTVAVVYGAGHVPAIVKGLYQHDYRVRGGDWLTLMPL
jgi:hypothetical protein